MISKFRQDINGLRAYAVLAVMLFHFGVPGFSGGFIGVDVFFVISGYLMTRILIEGLEHRENAGLSWVVSFYLARARRIIPALAVLCLVLLAVGWFALPSGDYKQLGTHSLAALAFLSNVKFWREAGYFDTASHDKWLLHTWSLSVEWQYYLLFPILLLFLWRAFPGRRVAAAALIVGMIVSLLLSAILTGTHPSAAFFLLPTRAWELFAGGLVFLFSTGWTLRETTARFLEAFGFVMIVGSTLLFDGTTPWPGLLAGFPVLGTVFVLVAARQASPWTRPLALQSLGLWSYSVYLWHWPLVVALVYLDKAEQWFSVAIAMVAAVLLGWLSFTWIETPVRRGLTRTTPTRAFIGVGTILGVVATPALAIRIDDGLPRRLTSEVELISAEAQNFNKRRNECHGFSGYDFKKCRYGGQNIRAILVGDSHASAVATALSLALPSPEQGLLTFTYTSCPTFFDVKKRNQPELKCAEFNEWFMSETEKLPPEIPVIVVNRSSSYAFGSNRPDEASYGIPSVLFDETVEAPTEDYKTEFMNHLVSSACRIQESRQVYLVRPIPEMNVDVPKVAARWLLLGDAVEISLSLSEYQDRHALVWRSQDKAAANCGVRILDPLPQLCENDRCDGLQDGRPLYYDSHHLSEFGNRRLIPMFEKVFSHDQN